MFDRLLYARIKRHLYWCVHEPAQTFGFGLKL